MTHPYYFSVTKRLFDITLSILLLGCLFPVLLLIGVTIAFSRGWPILFYQSRAGRDMKSFTIYKFRIMYVGAEQDQWRYQSSNQAPTPFYKNWHDPRFVGIGRWLSKTGLDELPQLINILKGEMSFIGPRPLPIYEAQKLPPDWDFRYQVKPGIFSEWSVNLDRHRSLAEWKSLEQETLQRGGPSYELGLIMRTLRSL